MLSLIYSWNSWPKKNTLFVLSFLPVIEWGFELISSGKRTTFGLDGRSRTHYELNNGGFDWKTALFFFCNLLGMFLLLWVAGEGDSWGSFGHPISGIEWAIGGTVVAFIGWRKLSNEVLTETNHVSSNFISVQLVMSLIFAVFTPAFFAIASGTQATSIVDLVLMIFIGLITSYGLYAGMVAITIVRKRSNFLLFGTLAMAIVLFIYGLGTDGVTVIALLGMVLAAFGVTVIYINETRKDETVDYSRSIPLIG
jgi:hypothetical protein